MEIKTPLKIYAYAYHIFRAWYNGSYTMATKSIKSLELHYTMTQFLIISDIRKDIRLRSPLPQGVLKIELSFTHEIISLCCPFASRIFK